MREGLGWCASALLTLVFWSVWIALALLLAFQIYIARTHELQLPRFVQRAVEERLAASGIHLAFGRARFDPSGRILADRVQLTLPGYEEPLITVRQVYARFNPWALLVDRFEPVELEVAGANFRIPAMLSPSGRADAIVGDLDAGLRPDGSRVLIDYLRCRVGGMAVAVDGAVDFSRMKQRPGAALPAADFLARNYARLSRQGSAVVASLAGLDRPTLSARLVASPANVAWIDATVVADGFSAGGPKGFRAQGLRLRGRLPLWDPEDRPVRLSAEAGELILSGGRGQARELKIWAQTRLVAARSGIRAADGAEVELAAAEIAAAGGDLENPVFRGHLAGWEPGKRSVQGSALAAIWSRRMSVQGTVDLDRRQGVFDLDGEVGPDALAFVEKRLGRSLRRWVELRAPISLSARAEFGPGWKFARISGRLAATDFVGSRVHLDEVRGRFDFDGRHLAVRDAYAGLGGNSAWGSFDEDVATRDYRFRLNGRVRPLDITAWIKGEWWPVLFGNFDFSADPIAADFDMTGNWRTGRKSMVFVSVDAAHPVVRGVPFDRVRGRFFIRPQFIDALAVRGERGAAAVRGRFARSIDFETSAWKGLDFDLSSRFDLPSARRMLGPDLAASVLDLFALERAPQVDIRAHLDGPGARGGPHLTLHVVCRGEGEFRFGGFPLDGAAFTADVRDDDVALEGMSAGFAGGMVSGRAHLSGRGADRRLHFEAALHEASLGPAITTVNGFTARRAHRPPPPPGEFVRERANVRLDADLTAEGGFGEGMGYHGAGSAALHGAGLGEIRMLGLLSALLPFTSLRFTAARSNFVLDGSTLTFTNLTLTGANSAIAAKGTYNLDDHTLDFRGTVSPFKESKTLPQRFMDVILTPLSEVLAIRLGGTIDKPSWVFVNGPANFLRGLNPGSAPLK